MKHKFLLIIFSIVSGILFTFYVLNKGVFYAKEEYLAYAFQVGAFKNLDNASKYLNSLNDIRGIIVKENDLYKIYVGIYKNTDVVNKMVVYFENNNIHIYLKSIKCDKDFYNILDNYEKIIINSDDTNTYNKINENILNIYEKSINNEKDN